MGILREDYRIVRSEPLLAAIEYTSFNSTALGDVQFDRTLWLSSENLRWVGKAIGACIARDESFILALQAGGDSLKVSETGYEYGAHIYIHNTRTQVEERPGKSWISLS